MTILIDIDNCINNFSQVLLRYCNQYYNTEYLIENVTTYDWFDKTFDNPWPLVRSSNFWDEVEVNAAAVYAINRMLLDNHKIYLVSASKITSELHHKVACTLKPFEGKLTENNIIITQNKSIVNGDVLIDDYMRHLNEFPNTTICYAQPWNKLYNGIYRTHSWMRIEEIIYQIKTLKGK